MVLMVIDAGGRDVCMPQPFLELRRLLLERIGRRCRAQSAHTEAVDRDL